MQAVHQIQIISCLGPLHDKAHPTPHHEEWCRSLTHFRLRETDCLIQRPKSCFTMALHRSTGALLEQPQALGALPAKGTTQARRRGQQGKGGLGLGEEELDGAGC